MMTTEIREKRVTWLALFTSTGTLICCALPMALVSLGLGSTVAALSSSLPLLVTISASKGWLFVASGILLAASAWLLFRARQGCPVGTSCNQSQRNNRRIFWVSVAIWGTGLLTAYVALPLRQWLAIQS